MFDTPTLERLARRTIELAAEARAAGNHPFGSLLVDASGEVVVETGNTVVTGRDATGHAELNVVRIASGRYDRAALAGTTLVTSTEPCPMCSGAIFWSGIGSVVFALGDVAFYDLVRSEMAEPDVLLVHTADLLRDGSRPVHVHGPMLEDEALEPHRGFWRTLGH